MTFQDIFKSSFLENISSVSILDMVLALVLAFGIGLFIFLVYKKTYQGVMYSSSFGVTLIALTMIPLAVVGSVVKSKPAQKGDIELNLEVRLKDDNTEFINALAEMEGVRSAVLVSYNGDYMKTGCLIPPGSIP